jgi:energy-coupling factor transport system substrate-specific component
MTISELFRPLNGSSASRTIVLLGVLVAIDATLRLIPSLLGASPIFVLIMLVGYIFGARIGFIMGVMTLLLSAAITAGIGPWLPFQMLCAGWIGMAAGWLPHDRGRLPLLVFGAMSGFLFGAVMNLYSWPYAAPGSTTDVGLYWNPTLSLVESLQRYASFYLATSLLHDATRAAANVIILLVLGDPVIRLLQRYQTRSSWSALSINDTARRHPPVEILPRLSLGRMTRKSPLPSSREKGWCEGFAFLPCGHARGTLAKLGEGDGAQVPLAAIRQDDHDQLPGIFRPLRQFSRRRRRSRARDANQQTLGLHQLVLGSNRRVDVDMHDFVVD